MSNPLQDPRIAVFDFKGSSLVTYVHDLPHVAAATANLAEDRLWVKRMKDVLEGELERRHRLIKKINQED